MDFSYRQATLQDIDALLLVERASFPKPWPAGAFEQELTLSQAELWLAIKDDQVAGYVDFWVVADEVELLNIAIAPQHRGLGLARGLMSLLEERSVERGGRTVYLEVRRSNEAAIGLYLKRGFVQVGIRKRYYSDNQEDAFILSKALAFEDPAV